MSARARTLALALCVLVVTALVGAEVAVQRVRLFRHYLLLSDDTSYSLMDVHRARLVERQGRIRTAIEELRTNNRHPLRTIPLIVLAPELLASKVGHLATSLPLLAIFLWALAWTVWERTRSVPYALSVVLLFAQLPGVYDLHLGLGAYLLDLPASFAVMAAILALLHSDGGKRLGWLVAFALMASLAALSRYVAGAFVFVAGLPIVLLFLVDRLRRERDFLRAVVAPAATIVAVIAVTAGPWLIGHLASNTAYYQDYGYQLNRRWTDCAERTGWFLQRFFLDSGTLGWLASAVLGCLACFQLFLALRLRAWKELLVSTWLAIAVPLFLVFVLRSIARHVQAYAAPPVFFCLVNAVPWQGRFRLSRRWSLGLLAGVLALFPARLWQLHLDNGALARSPSPTAAEDKRTIVALAERLAPFGDGARWGVFAGPYGEKVDLECFHRFGVLLDSRVSLTPHEPDWRADYPRMNPRRIAGRLMAEAEDGIEIAVVFQDPQRAWQGTQLHNWISQRVAALMSREIPKRWEHIFSVPSSTVGDLAGYRNPRAATAPARRSPASP